MVFVILEYSVLLFLIREDGKRKGIDVKGTKKVPVVNIRTTCDRIDTASLYIFPVVSAMINVCYWVINLRKYEDTSTEE